MKNSISIWNVQRSVKSKAACQISLLCRRTDCSVQSVAKSVSCFPRNFTVISHTNQVIAALLNLSFFFYPRKINEQIVIAEISCEESQPRGSQVKQVKYLYFVLQIIAEMLYFGRITFA